MIADRAVIVDRLTRIQTDIVAAADRARVARLSVTADRLSDLALAVSRMRFQALDEVAGVVPPVPVVPAPEVVAVPEALTVCGLPEVVA